MLRTKRQAWPGAVYQDSTDGRALEEVVLDPQNYVVGFLAFAGAGLDHPNCPGARFAVDPEPTEDGDRDARRVQADPPGVEELGSLRRAEREEPARLEKELALLRKKHGKP